MGHVFIDERILKEKILGLEETELRDQDETTSDIYKQLMIFYMLDEEPVKAKLLWKRIPQRVKTSDAELNKIWEVVQFFIQRKFSQAFESASRLNSHSWSNQEVEKSMKTLVEKSKERLFELMNAAYSSISVQEVASCLNLSNEETVKLGLGHGCSLDETQLFLIPKKREKVQVVEIPNQIQMQKLTSIVSFLET